MAALDEAATVPSDGEGDGEESDTSGLEALGALCAAAGDAVPGEDVPAPSSLRCLDPHHPANCERCRPPPAAGQEVLYRLVGDAGKKNGEKKLRRMILSCAEWTSSHSRDALADRMEAEGRNDVAAILRLKRSASLRKESMLTLAREWRYKADLWQRGSSGVPGVPRRRVAPAAAGGAPRIGAPRSGGRRIEGDGGAYQRRTQADHNAAAQAAHSAQALQAHLAALAAPNSWLNALRGLQMMAPQQAEPSANASAAAVQALRGAISTSARRIATDTAAVWEGVAARAAAATLHVGGAAPVTPTAADALNDNAQSLSVARWLRSVAGAHASALDDEWRASGSPQAGPALTALLRQMSDYSSQLDAQLALVRAELAAPSAGGADARSSWAGQLQRTLDDALTWLAHAKSSAAAMTGAPPGGAAHAGATVARITADFFGAAEEALLLRRQWLVLSPSPGAPAALGAHDGAAAAAAVMAAVMATAGVMPPQQVSQVAAYPQPPPVPEPMVQPPSSAAAVPMAA